MKPSCLTVNCWPDQQWDDILFLQQLVVSSGGQRSAQVCSGPGVLGEGVSSDGTWQKDVLTHNSADRFGFGDEPRLHALLRLCQKIQTISKTTTTIKTKALRQTWKIPNLSFDILSMWTGWLRRIPRILLNLYSILFAWICYSRSLT